MKCPNGLNRTIIVSFPRSGHHLLVRGMLAAVPERIVYSEFYKSAHNVTNCEFVNLQKTHDFNLETPIVPDAHYIVQIRGFELAVESWYKLAVAEGHIGSFEDFREEKSVYFDGFMAKWVNTDLPNKIVLPYHDLVSNKSQTVIHALRHMGVESLQPHQLDALAQWEKGSLIKKRYNERILNNSLAE